MKQIPRVVSVLSVCILSILAYSPIAHTSAAENKPLASFSGVGRPFMDAQSARPLPVEYSGDFDAAAALRSGAKPTALTSADFDADGAPDLVAGYRTASGGVVTITRGNPDAFAPKDPRVYARALKGEMPPEFLKTTVAVSVPESPDFLATADFDGDGQMDLLVAKRGGGMYILSGDGRGNLAAARRIDLPGDVTALAVNGAGHVAVGIQSGSNLELLIFDPRSKGGLLAPVASHSLSASADSIAWGRLSYNTTDLAVATGNRLAIYYDVLKSGDKSDIIELGFHARAIAVDQFVWNRDGRLQIAALADEGSIHIFQHGSLDTRPVTKAEIPGRRAQMRAMAKRTDLDPTALGAWSEASKIAGATSSTEGVAPHALLQTSRLVPAAGASLMVLDAAQKHVGVVNTTAASQALAISGSPVAAHTLPAMFTGRRSIAVLTTSQVAPVTLTSGPDPTFNVTTTADIDPGNICGGTSTTVPSPLSLREAVCLANNSGAVTSTINVPAGTYSLTSLDTGELQIGVTPGSSISVVGVGASTTIIQQTDGHDRVFEQDAPFNGGVVVSISGVTIQNGDCTSGTDCGYGGGGMLGLGQTGDNLTLTNVTFNNNVTGATDDGGALGAEGSGNLTITGCIFSNNTATSAIGGGIDWNVNASSSNLSVTGSTFSSNKSTVELQGGGMYLTPVTGNTATISNSTFTGNTVTTGKGGAIYSEDSGVTVSKSRIVGNTAGAGSGVYVGGSGSATITNNWWGCNAGPGNAGCDTVGTDSGTANPSPNLVLSISASLTQLQPAQTSTLTADLTHNSSTTGGFSVPDGTSATFSGTLGTVNPTGTTTTSGQATSTFTAGSTAGSGQGSVTVDNQTVNVPITIVTPPSITSANSTTFTVGSAGSFTVTATGSPAPTFSETGVLPSGVTLSTAGLLSGTPAAGTGGTYPITITASNGVSPNATQPFTLTVNQPPAITSANATTFGEGSAGSFTVTATGFPAATFSETGALPSGVTLSTSGSLSGTPAIGTAGNYPITITASNGVSPNATQGFTLTVSTGAAVMISPTPGTILTGTTQTFTWTTGTGVQYYCLYVGTTPLAHDIYDTGEVKATTSATVTGIPAGGATLYVTLFSYFSGSSTPKEYFAYTYTESGAPAPAVMTSPTNGSTLTGDSQLFTWSSGAGVTKYLLYIGTAPATHDVYDATIPEYTLSANVTGIPTGGGTLYVSLYSMINGVWQTPQTTTYIESGTAVPATISSPTAGSTLGGSTQLFTWNPGSGVTQYLLYVGTAPLAHDVYNSGVLNNATTSANVTGIPTGGAKVYVTLWSYINGHYQPVQSSYTEAP